MAHRFIFIHNFNIILVIDQGNLVSNDSLFSYNEIILTNTICPITEL